jgi:3-methyl-2-oxobutanoate hydroxymethyltransferase
VLVLHDLLGFDDDFQPKFLKRYATLGQEITAALGAYASDVRSGAFPTEAHSFKD